MYNELGPSRWKRVNRKKDEDMRAVKMILIAFIVAWAIIAFEFIMTAIWSI